MKKRQSGEALPTYKKAIVQVIAYKRIRNVVGVVLRRFNLNTTQWMILGTLYENTTGLRITDIAKSLGVEVPLITRLSQALVKAGLVTNKLDKTDRRARPLLLTSQGESVVQDVEHELSKRTFKLEDGLSKRDINSYFDTLAAFMQNATLLDR